MRPSPLIRPFGPPSPRRGEESSRKLPAAAKSLLNCRDSAAGFFSPPGRRWREAPDEGASTNA